MAENTKLTCLNCGGNLQVSASVDHITCHYCKTEHLVNPENGMVSLAQLVKDIHAVKNGKKKSASELKITRLDNEIKEIKELLWKLYLSPYYHSDFPQFEDSWQIDFQNSIKELIKKENPKIRFGVFAKVPVQERLFGNLTSDNLIVVIKRFEISEKMELFSKSKKRMSGIILESLRKLLSLTREKEMILNGNTGTVQI
jgi:hypothetical protein